MLLAQPRWRRFLALCLTFALAACSTYDFSGARQGNGSWDVERLLQDQRAAAGQSLGSLTWVPLLWFDFDGFGVAKPNRPDGYTMHELDGYGPLFAVQHARWIHYDGMGNTHETETRNTYLWGLYGDMTTTLQTMQGERVETGTRLLFGLLSWSDVYYVRE